MAREWKLGDVAWVNDARAVRADHVWHTTSGILSDHNVAYARPLVVLDHNAGELRDLLHVLGDAACEFENEGAVAALAILDRLRDAIRVVVTPPKPDEPTGLGAVVEDAEGIMYVRVALEARGYPDWKPSHSIDRTGWINVPAVKVLSEGVTP